MTIAKIFGTISGPCCGSKRLKGWVVDEASVAGARLRAVAISVAPGTINAATAHLETVATHLDVVNRQIIWADARLDTYPKTCRR